MVETEAEGMDGNGGEETAVNGDEAKNVVSKGEETHCTHDYQGIHENITHADGMEHVELSEDPELIKVKYGEAHHLTGMRMLFYFVNFCFLFAA